MRFCYLNVKTMTASNPCSYRLPFAFGIQLLAQGISSPELLKHFYG